jgi:uncharacterized LabA/DUF88 family protein
MLANHFRHSRKTALFIDGAHIHTISQTLGFTIDYRKFSNYFGAQTDLLRSYYYVASSADEEYSVLKPLIDWLSYNNYQVTAKPCKEFPDASGQRRMKPSLAVEMAVDMLEMNLHLDEIILAAGNGDLRRAVESVQRQGTIVTAVSTVKAKGICNISDDLRRQADHFLDLADIQTEIERQKERPAHLRELSGAA